MKKKATKKQWDKASGAERKRLKKSVGESKVKISGEVNFGVEVVEFIAAWSQRHGMEFGEGLETCVEFITKALMGGSDLDDAIEFVGSIQTYLAAQLQLRDSDGPQQ